MPRPIFTCGELDWIIVKDMLVQDCGGNVHIGDVESVTDLAVTRHYEGSHSLCRTLRSTRRGCDPQTCGQPRILFVAW